MTIKDNIFKAYDIRGVYPSELNENNIQVIVKAIYTYLKPKTINSKFLVAIGYDMRLSSQILFNSAKKSLLECGASIIDLGMISTPTLYYSLLKYKYDLGIQISASHNPKEYNGLKIVKRNKNQLIKIGKNTGMEEIKKISLSNYKFQIIKSGKVNKNLAVLKSEVADALKSIKPKYIKKLKIVADPGNAMGGLYINEICKKIPSNLIKMNFKLDGTFPSHQPDPLQFDTLRSLQQKIKEEKADLGIAPDGDGDRVFFIDEKGNVIPATLISSLIANEILCKNKKDKILVDIRYTNNVKNICKKYNSEVSISQVGHALITEQLNKERAAFAGESSGHFYFRETGGAESSIRVIITILNVIGRENKPISKIVKNLQSSYESGEINFELPQNITSKKIFDYFAKEYKNGKISFLDGISIDFKDWRFNIRASNTEPLLRLNVEANNKNILYKNLKNILSEIIGFGAKRK